MQNRPQQKKPPDEERHELWFIGVLLVMLVTLLFIVLNWIDK